MELKKSNSNIKNQEKLSEYLSLKEEYKKINAESKKLKEYLDVNIFNYTENKHDADDIFKIKNSPLRFIEQIRTSEISPDNFPILEINNVSKCYSSKSVATLINISMKVYLGDFHVIVGNYSSGKTTLFNCLTGLEPYDGEIQIDGKINKSEFCLVEQTCGFVPYDHKWDIFSTVEEVILNKFQELDLTEAYAKKYITESLEQFNISLLRNVHIVDLSLLEIRKIQLVIALINDPHLLIFDQPLLGLQYFEEVEYLVLLAKLRTKERSILVFSHEISEFAKYANSITILSKGKIYYTGSITNLLLTHLHKYSISTSDNEAAVNILKTMECKNTINDLKNMIYVKFEGKLDLLFFQKECSDKNIIINSLSQVNVDIEDLYPVLLNKGTKEAIYEINKLHYFSVN